MMHRRKDYWGPDGRFVSGYLARSLSLTLGVYQRHTSILNVSWMSVSTSTSPVTRSYSFHSTRDLVSALASRCVLRKKAVGLSGLCNGTHAAHVICIVRVQRDVVLPHPPPAELLAHGARPLRAATRGACPFGMGARGGPEGEGEDYAQGTPDAVCRGT